MKIRFAIPDDIEKVLEIWTLAGLSTRPIGRDHPQSIAKQISQKNSWILVAEEEQQIIGAVLVTHDTRKGWINRLATHPERAREGIASKLLEESEKTLLQQGIEVYCALIVEDNTKSRKLFEKSNYSHYEGVTYYSKRLSQDK
ncbi:MAG TPA: GNAT family N-acetyltransferase [Candidatus Glassbacteria bacterium]|nr:GNAT family N-acetyltransferase [Candidatus Glassbacteria bacterium]